MFGQYGNFINDPTTQIAAQMGQNAFKHGQEYLEQNVSIRLEDRGIKHGIGIDADW